MDADADHAVVQLDDREGVVDFGGGDVVDRERGHGGRRQLGRRGRHRHVREAGAAREVLEQEFGQVQFLRRGDAAAGQHQLLRIGVQLVAGQQIRK